MLLSLSWPSVMTSMLTIFYKKIPQSKYMPYDSVLKNFRSFRFNPDFSNSVPGGFRSLTYSSKIDSGKVLCATEARGEVCQDPKCEDQHFSQMGLPGMCSHCHPLFIPDMIIFSFPFNP